VGKWVRYCPPKTYCNGQSNETTDALNMINVGAQRVWIPIGFI